MEFKEYFQLAIDRHASDLHLIGGSRPSLRIDGELVPISEDIIPDSFLRTSIKTILTPEQQESFAKEKELDFSLDIFEERFRINLHFQQRRIGLAARQIKTIIPTPEEAGFSETMCNLTRLKDGLILITGPSGVGKSTTIATMISLINNSKRSHIITIEDPIEYVFKDKYSIIEQREIGTDTPSFKGALKAILRQDPNVIMIGEMRDVETISAALTAAETGHLVLSTLHTNSAAESVARIIDSFPAQRRQQVLTQFSLTLRAVISQELLPKIGGGQVAAREVMINNQAVSNLIRENKVAQLNTVIKTSYQQGMIDMNKSIDLLYEQGYIDELTVSRYKRNLETKAIYN